MKHPRLAAFVVAALALAGCEGSTRPDGPGTMTASLVSPNGAEGAAILDVIGSVDAFNCSSDVSVYTTPIANGTRVILVRLNPGALQMSMRVPDVSNPPAITVVEVAAGDDRLRPSVADYHVDIR